MLIDSLEHVLDVISDSAFVILLQVHGCSGASRDIKVCMHGLIEVV